LVVDRVKAGRNVLVTCMAGQNRSGIVTAMALCKLTGASGQECVDHVSRTRPFALNNRTFAQYVIDNFPGARNP
jgi:protein-tyrosine phosphatase